MGLGAIGLSAIGLGAGLGAATKSLAGSWLGVTLLGGSGFTLVGGFCEDTSGLAAGVGSGFTDGSMGLLIAEFSPEVSFTQEGVGFSEAVGLGGGGQFFLTGIEFVLS